MDGHNVEIAWKVAQCVGDRGCTFCYLFIFLVSTSVCVKVIQLLCNSTSVEC